MTDGFVFQPYKMTKSPIAVGGTRLVHGYGRELVVKIPRKEKFEEGSFQNDTEASIYKDEKSFFRRYLAKVVFYEYVDGVPYLLQEKVRKLVPPSSDISLLSFYKNINEKLPFTIEQLKNFAETHDLVLDGLLKASSWGKDKHGRLKLLDYGLTHKYCSIYDE